MRTLSSVLVSALAGALGSKILLRCFKQDGSIIGLFLSWLLASFLAMCTPYPFLGPLIFGFLFVKVTSVEKLWPYGILAVLVFWGLQSWFDSVIPEILWSSQQDLQQRWSHLTNSANMLYSSK